MRQKIFEHIYLKMSVIKTVQCCYSLEHHLSLDIATSLKNAEHHSLELFCC